MDYATRIPQVLSDLRLPPSQLQRHMAWDVGAQAVARQVAETLDAPIVAQNFALVTDRNRNLRVAELDSYDEGIERDSW